MSQRKEDNSTLQNVTEEVKEFYERYPYPRPIDSLDKYRRLWQDRQRRHADYHLFWPVGIQMVIWRCFNRWPPAAGPRFIGLFHHTDTEREWAYDKDSPSGRLLHALEKANARGWKIIDMKQVWKRVFSFDIDYRTIA